MSDEQLATIEDKGKQLDALAQKYSKAIAAQETPFSSALELAKGISALRVLLDDQIMAEIMQLANTPLGFRTDRPSDKNPKPYAIAEVKDAIIEAALRGFRVAGNEFNIIAGNFYGAKNGLRRKVVSYPGVTDFRDTYGVPRMIGDRGAVIAAGATWMKDGVKGQLNREFAIRSNAAMGTDALLGKCERKLCAAVLNWLSGITTPEGEVDDAIPVQAQVMPADAPKPLLPTNESLSSPRQQDKPKEKEPPIDDAKADSKEPKSTEAPATVLTKELLENAKSKTSDSAPIPAPEADKNPTSTVVDAGPVGTNRSPTDSKTGEPDQGSRSGQTATVSDATSSPRVLPSSGDGKHIEATEGYAPTGDDPKDIGYRHWIRKQLVEAGISEPAFTAYLRRIGIATARSKNLDYIPEEIVKGIVDKWHVIAEKYKDDQGP